MCLDEVRSIYVVYSIWIKWRNAHKFIYYSFKNYDKSGIFIVLSQTQYTWYCDVMEINHSILKNIALNLRKINQAFHANEYNDCCLDQQYLILLSKSIIDD